ncbi:hypothetical protein ACU045_03830 [Microbacterium sp. MAHUQ-60]|uniref:hypothetical protein n=1 Tax=unclassified Microbacterium TaxID=2609290 RepID=UPI00360648AD
MSVRFADLVRESSRELSLRELLEQPVTELIGVSPDAASALSSLTIGSIFDLGTSSVFARASAALSAAGSDVQLVPQDILGPSGSGVAPEDVPALPIVRLQGISQAAAAAITAALAVTTIRELALWPPRRVAHEMVGVSLGTDLGDSEERSADELRPAFGEYPTERVYYDTLFMLGTDATQAQQPLSAPLSLEKLASGGLAFGAPAIGAIATYAQSWFAQGLTLGHMVHSLALAPGEATRLAVIDWTRKTTTTSSESVDEGERLSNSTNHVRAISEVQNAVAEEMQEGGSIATGWSKSSSTSKGVAASYGGGIAGVAGSIGGALGFGGGGSYTSQSSETQSEATSASWSVGSRSVFAEMNQRVNDRTEQYATSVRNRRATAVREVSQSEHEQVSTRIVANYNHMHALTVQYYEVVQIYRVTVQLNRFDRALFLPFALLDFSTASGPDLVARFRGELLAGALTPRAADLLLDDRGRIELHSAVRVPRAITVADVALAPASAMVRTAMRRAGDDPSGPVDPPVDPPVVPPVGDPVRPPRVVTRFTVVRPGPIAEIVPGDARITSIAFDDVVVDRVRVDQPGVAAEASTFMVAAGTGQVDFPQGIVARGIDAIHVACDAAAAGEGSMVIRYESEGQQSLAVVPIDVLASSAMQKVCFLHGDAAGRRDELLAHLQANRSHYTRVVLGRLDAASLALLLADVSWLGRPLADQVEPNPIAVSGNYLVLRAPAEDGDASGLAQFASWGALLRDRGIDFGTESTRLVPIPTAGVFAEAVLGRSNSAEKLDITRFWNWQDSPIPLQPPEISPVATGSRGTTDDLKPGPLGTPVLGISTPTVLPEPAGLSAALGALANGSMFRDMAGLAGTQDLAQEASTGTLNAATEAGRIASTNFQTATTQATEMGKAAANMFTAIKSAEIAKGREGGISGDGARINHGRDMDERGLTSGGSTGRSSADAGGEAPSSSAGGASGDDGSGGSTDFMPGPSAFLREVAAADDASAFSHDRLGAANNVLGVPVTLADFEPGRSKASTIGSSKTLLLQTLRKDAVNAKIALRGVTLRDLATHPQGKAYAAVEFGAWTDDPKTIFVNLAALQNMIADAVTNGALVDDAEDFVRGIGVLTLRHEAQHAAQFKTLTSRAPTFAQMISFEASAYKGDVTWLTDQKNKDLLTNTFGWEDSRVAEALTASTERQAVFDAFAADAALSDEAKRRDALKAGANGETFLPDEIRVGGKRKKDYVARNLYR